MNDREHLTRILLTVWLDRSRRQVEASPEEHCVAHADAILSSGWLAEQRAEALREAANKISRAGYWSAISTCREADAFHLRADEEQ